MKFGLIGWATIYVIVLAVFACMLLVLALFILPNLL